MLSRRSLFTVSLGAVAVCAGCGSSNTAGGAATSTRTEPSAGWRTTGSAAPTASTAAPTASASTLATQPATTQPTPAGTAAQPTQTATETATGSASATAPGSAGPAGTSTATGRPTRAQVVAEFSGQRPREWGLHTTGTINRGSASAARAGLVALTFDACGGVGGAGYDADLIALLRRLQVPATLTLNARWVLENESIARQLGSDPLFEIQSHGQRHLPLSVDGASAYGIPGTESVGAVYDELLSGTATIQAVARTNTVQVMRPGTAYCDDVAARIARAVGMPVLGFSINADEGATAPASRIVQNLAPLAGGDIVISHMNHPEHSTAEGCARALPGLLRRGVRFAHVSQVI